MKIDNSLVGIQTVCFIVNNLEPRQGERPIVIGRVALTHNSLRMPDDIYMMASHISLTPLLLFYLGFETADPLPCLSTACHFVKYIFRQGTSATIQVIQEDDGSFSLVRLKEDGSFRLYKISFLDDLQQIVADVCETYIHIRLETINHACLYEAIVPQWINEVSKAVSVNGHLSIEEFNNLLLNMEGVLDYDLEPVFKYGLYQKVFRLEPNSFGCFISE